MMRSLLIFGVLAIGIAACGSDRSSEASGAGGAPTFGGSGGTAGMGGSNDGGAAGTSGAAGMGGSGGLVAACDNPSDLDAIANAGDTLRSIGGTCGAAECSAHLFDPTVFATCISDCLETNVAGLSSTCSSCYGEVARCGLSAFCLDCGNDTCSQGCLDCLNGVGCLTALDVCTGIPSDDCP